MIKGSDARGFHQAITYDPYSNQAYAGDHADNMPNHPQALLATYSKPMVSSLYADHKVPEQEPILSASMKETLGRLEGLNANAVLQAAPDGQGNSQNLTHLQLIRLLPEIQGKPTEYFYLENAFLSRSIPKLEFRESWTSVESLVKMFDRMEEADKVKNVFSEIKYDLKKLVGKVYTPIEDMYRTIINPMAIDKQMMEWAFQYRRNQLAIDAIKLTGHGVQRDSSGHVKGVEILSASNKMNKADSFHSDEHVAEKMNDLMLQFLAHNDVAIDTVIMNPRAYAQYTENTWTRMGGPTGLQPIRMPKGGVVPLPGFENITCIVDVAVPHLPAAQIQIGASDSAFRSDIETNEGVMFFLNRANALRMGEGPKIMRRYYDEERDAEAIKKIDFVQFLNVDYELSSYQPAGEDKDQHHDRIGGRFFSFAAKYRATV